MSVASRFDTLFPIVAAAMLAAACSLAVKPLQVQVLPADSETNPSRYMVVTIRNESSGVPADAGASFRKYSPGEYVVTSAARSAAKALARDYGLREASTWSIAPLHLYCVMFQVPAAQESVPLIEQLRHDPRVNAVQPLNEFETQARIQSAGPTE